MEPKNFSAETSDMRDISCQSPGAWFVNAWENQSPAVLPIIVGLAGFCAGPTAVGARARHAALSVAFSCAIATGLFGLGWQATRELRKTTTPTRRAI